MAKQKLNLLAISLGNTRTRIGAFVDGDLTECDTFENGRLDDIADAMDHAFAPLKERDDTTVVLSSVVPDHCKQIEAMITERLGFPIMRVEKDLPIPIGRQLDPEAIVGEDRLLNAAAAFDVLKQACIVVDAGTAITVDFVDGSGTFHGGAIAPGAQLQLDALRKRTGMLPELEFAAPTEIIGHNTQQAMLTGVFHGLRGTVRELAEAYAEKIGNYPSIIATGGDAQLLFREYELVDRVVPNLTLQGIAVTVQTALDQNAKDADTA